MYISIFFYLLDVWLKKVLLTWNNYIKHENPTPPPSVIKWLVHTPDMDILAIILWFNWLIKRNDSYKIMAYVRLLYIGNKTNTTSWGSVMVVIVRQLDLQLPMQSVPITTNVVSSNPAQARCIRYNIMC